MPIRSTSPKRKGRAGKATPGRVKTKAKAAVAAPRRAEKATVRIFVSYSHRDADAQRRLEVHLAPLKADNVETWFDGDMNAGDKLDTEIARHLRRADIFVALLSADYLASNYCWNIEYRRAMNRRARGTIRVVAVALKPCDWKSTTAAGFKLLPNDGRHVSRWRSADEAFLDIAQGIRRVVAAVRKARTVEASGGKSPAGRSRKPVAKAVAKPAAKRAVTAKAKKPAPRAKAGTRTAAKARTVARPKVAAKTGAKKPRTAVRRRAKGSPKRR